MQQFIWIFPPPWNHVWHSFADCETFIFDPSGLEEKVMDGKLIISMNKHREVCCLQTSGPLQFTSEQVGGGGAGGASKSFDLVKIWAKSAETFAKSLKIWANSLKIWTKMVPNLVWLKKWQPTFAEAREDLVLEIITKTVLVRKYLHKKWPKNFSCKFGEIRARIFLTPRNCLPRTPGGAWVRVHGYTWGCGYCGSENNQSSYRCTCKMREMEVILKVIYNLLRTFALWFAMCA